MPDRKSIAQLGFDLARAQGAVQALELCLACVAVDGTETADAIAIRCMLEGARGVLSRAETAWAAEVARADSKSAFGPHARRNTQAMHDRNDRIRDAEQTEAASEREYDRMEGMRHG